MTKLKTINEIKKEIEKLKPFLIDIDYSGDIDIDCLKLKAQLQTSQDILDEIEELFIEGKLRECYKNNIREELKQRIVGNEKRKN